jgi:hypothetical protein
VKADRWIVWYPPLNDATLFVSQFHFRSVARSDWAYYCRPTPSRIYSIVCQISYFSLEKTRECCRGVEKVGGRWFLRLALDSLLVSPQTQNILAPKGCAICVLIPLENRFVKVNNKINPGNYNKQFEVELPATLSSSINQPMRHDNNCVIVVSLTMAVASHLLSSSWQLTLLFVFLVLRENKNPRFWNNFRLRRRSLSSDCKTVDYSTNSTGHYNSHFWKGQRLLRFQSKACHQLDWRTL